MKLKTRYKVLIIFAAAVLLYFGCRYGFKKEVHYVSDKHNISFDIPKEWTGKYKIEENDDGVFVYYKGIIPLRTGLLFAVDKSAEVYDGSLQLNIKGKVYKVGGPTDVGFDDESFEYDSYEKMRCEASQVVKSLKVQE